MTFRAVSIIALLVVIGGVGFHALVFPFGPVRRWTFGEIVRVKVHAFTLLFLPQDLNWIGRVKKLLLLLAMLAFLVLLLTGFGPLIFGYRLSGYLLMIHVTFAPILIGSAALLALGWAHGMAFSPQDRRIAAEGLCFKSPVNGCWLTDSPIGQKLCFWLLIFLSLPLTLSSIVSMFNLFGTQGQEFLYHLHRWTALAFACTAIICLYILVRRQIVSENTEQH